MIMVWVILLTLTALLWLVPPLLRGGRRRGPDQEDMRLSIYRENLQEIETELQAGQVDTRQVDNVRVELERALLQERAAESPLPVMPAESPDNRMAALLVGLWIVAASAGLYYFKLGNPQLIELDRINRSLDSETEMPDESVRRRMVELLERHLARNPDDANGRYYLATAYASTQDYRRAADSYARLLEQTGDVPEVLLAYIDVLVRLKEGMFAGEPQQLIQRLLAIDPDNYTGVLYAGLAAEQDGDLARANGYYRRLLPALQANPQLLQTITMLIARNDAVLGTDAGGDGDVASALAASMTVRVTVAAELVDRISPDAVLFVYAQSTDGTPMPVAVYRGRASELPATISLDDSMAMMPGRSLSAFETVRLTARLSATGEASPTSGDLSGVIDEAGVDADTVYDLVIDAITP